ncbi:MAG: hypothetical protein CNIPEHKO_02157 [Anaerolineales bacterium]|nr:hypothetical protein [Anaerolineales bacterium]
MTSKGCQRRRRIIQCVGLIGGGFAGRQCVADTICDILPASEIKPDNSIESCQVTAGDGDIVHTSTNGCDKCHCCCGGAVHGEIADAHIDNGFVESGAEHERIGIGWAGGGGLTSKGCQRRRRIIQCVGLIGGGFAGRQCVADTICDILSASEIKPDNSIESRQVAAGDGDIVHTSANGCDERDGRGGGAVHGEIADAHIDNGFVESGAEHERIGIGWAGGGCLTGKRGQCRCRIIQCVGLIGGGFPGGERIANRIGNVLPASEIKPDNSIESRQVAAGDGDIVHTSTNGCDKCHCCCGGAVHGEIADAHVDNGFAESRPEHERIGIGWAGGGCLTSKGCQRRRRIIQCVGLIGSGFPGGERIAKGIGDVLSASEIKPDNSIESRQVAAGDGDIVHTSANGCDERDGCGGCPVHGEIADAHIDNGFAESGAEHERIGIGRRGGRSLTSKGCQRRRRIIQCVGLIGGGFAGRQCVADTICDILSASEIKPDNSIESRQVAAGDGDIVHTSANGCDERDGRGGGAVHGEIADAHIDNGFVESGAEHERIGIGWAGGGCLTGKRGQCRCRIIQCVGLIGGGFPGGERIANRIGNVLPASEIKPDNSIESRQVAARDGDIVHTSTNGCDKSDGRRSCPVHGEIADAHIDNGFVESGAEHERIGIGR